MNVAKQQIIIKLKNDPYIKHTMYELLYILDCAIQNTYLSVLLVH